METRTGQESGGKMLEVQHLSIAFHDRRYGERVVKDVSFSMDEGEILGLVGESGSGKTMTALSVIGLLSLHARVHEGSRILFRGRDLVHLSPREWATVQGQDISMVFQEPMTALNPTMKIGKQVEEALRLHTNLPREERRLKVYQALRDVELEEVEQLYGKYPHELSGGMRQRVMIAAAVICRPKLLIADEPTTALDVATQEQILALLQKLNRQYEMGILFISHNLRVVKSLCEKVLVMKEGEIVDRGNAGDLFTNPSHPYTRELVEAIPTRMDNALYERIMGGVLHG